MQNDVAPFRLVFRIEPAGPGPEFGGRQLGAFKPLKGIDNNKRVMLPRAPVPSTQYCILVERFQLDRAVQYPSRFGSCWFKA